MERRVISLDLPEVPEHLRAAAYAPEDFWDVVRAVLDWAGTDEEKVAAIDAIWPTWPTWR